MVFSAAFSAAIRFIFLRGRSADSDCLENVVRPSLSDENTAGDRTIILILDELDYDAVQTALAMRQGWRIMPLGTSNLPGSIVAEICRGWIESLSEEGETL